MWLFAHLISSSIRKRYCNLHYLVTSSFLSISFDNQNSCMLSRQALGTLSNDNDDGSKNITLKNEFTSFQTLQRLFGIAQFVKFRRLFLVGDKLLSALSMFKQRREKLSQYVRVLYEASLLEVSLSSRVVDVKEMYQKA